MSAAALARVFGPVLQSKTYHWDRHSDALSGEEVDRAVKKRRQRYEERFICAVKVFIYFASELFPALDSKVEWRLSTLINCQGQEVLCTLSF